MEVESVEDIRVILVNFTFCLILGIIYRTDESVLVYTYIVAGVRVIEGEEGYEAVDISFLEVIFNLGADVAVKIRAKNVEDKPKQMVPKMKN